MKHALARVRRSSLFALVLALGATLAAAQVPVGTVVVSSFHEPGLPGVGGLYLVDPVSGGATAVVPLNADLTGIGSTLSAGANSVLIHPADRSLVAGELGPQGTVIDLHWIQVNGSTVVSDQTFYLGVETSPYGGGVAQAAFLPDGRVLVGVFGIGAGPLAGVDAGIVDLASGGITPVAISLPPTVLNHALNSLCLDLSGTVAWFTMDNGDGTSELCSAPLASGTATQADHLCFDGTGLAYEFPSGHYAISGIFGSCGGAILEYDPAADSSSSCTAGFLRTNALTIDSASGDRFVAARTSLALPYCLYRVTDPGCVATLVSPGPAGGWGLLSGVDLSRPALPSAPFCFGDGGGSACPCGNNGALGRGCENSASTGGALLSAGGDSWLAGDTLVLTSSSELPSALSIFLQGNAAIAAANFGDGLRCTGGILKRLYIHNAAGGVASAPQAGDLPISARSAALGDVLAAGAIRYYQTYYRDPVSGFCSSPTGNNWNISNGLSAIWSP